MKTRHFRLSQTVCLSPQIGDFRLVSPAEVQILTQQWPPRSLGLKMKTDWGCQQLWTPLRTKLTWEILTLPMFLSSVLCHTMSILDYFGVYKEMAITKVSKKMGFRGCQSRDKLWCLATHFILRTIAHEASAAALYVSFLTKFLQEASRLLDTACWVLGCQDMSWNHMKSTCFTSLDVPPLYTFCGRTIVPLDARWIDESCWITDCARGTLVGFLQSFWLRYL